jgi:hypothetical protein
VSQTYTSNTLRVSHGEITSHTTPSDINVLSAQARWQGVNTTTESTTTETVEGSNVKSASFEISGSDSYAYLTDMGVSLPDVDEGFDSYTLRTENTEPHNNEWNYEVYTSIYDLEPVYELEWEKGYDSYQMGPTDYTGVSRGHEDLYSYYDPSEYELNSFVVTPTEDGYTMYLEGAVEAFYSYETTVTETTTHYTTDPYVTRDVSGSYTGTLSDGEWSPWVTLNGLEEGVNEFYHNISGSGEAYFEFEYTYEEVYPTVQKQLRLYDADQNAIHTVALADPSDSQLDYNHHRYALNGTVYALDVVDPSDENAIDWVKWYHPTHGEYCPRAYDTIQL